MSKIISVQAREIIDSRGNPTIEVACELGSGAKAHASVPSGASKGVHEALELRDSDRGRYNGLGVLTAVSNVNEEINRHIRDKEFNQGTLDRALIELDGTVNKSRLGGNAILGVSLSFARTKAREEGKELYEYLGSLADNRNFKLPEPMFNILNGGKHADSGLDIQEFMIGAIGLGAFSEKIRAAAEVFISLRNILQKKGYAISVGDEGGFAPKLSSNEEAFGLIEQAIKEAGYSFDEIKIGIDAAASTFYQKGAYQLKIDGGKGSVDSHTLVGWYEKLVDAHPIIFIEDGLAEDDWEGFREMMGKLGSKIKIVGDDLTVTNIKRIETAIKKKPLIQS